MHQLIMFNVLYLPPNPNPVVWPHGRRLSLHYRTKSPDVFTLFFLGGGGGSLFWFIFLVVVGLMWMGVELGSPLVWGQNGGWARPVVGITLCLFISMSALIVVGGIVSFLGVWRCGRYGYDGLVLSSLGYAG